MKNPKNVGRDQDIINITTEKILSNTSKLIVLIFCLSCMSIATNAQQEVKLYPSTIRVEKGKTKTVTAVAYTSPTQPVYNASFSFSNSNSNVATLTTTTVSGDNIDVPSTPPPNLRTVTGNAAGSTTVTASWNGTTSSALTIIVDDPASSPTAIIHGDNDASGGAVINTQVGEAIEINAESSRGVSRVEWDWNDGDKTTDLLSATHAYLATGNYSLTLRITNNVGQTATSVVTVNVQAQTACGSSNTITVASISALKTQYENIPLTGGKCILLAPGVYVGELELIARNFTDYVTIGSTAAMPSILNRISPTDSGLVTLRSSSNQSSVSPLVIKNGATKLRFVGIKFDPASAPADASDTNSNYYVVKVGEPFTQTNVSQNPTKIIFQHCVINPNDNVKVPHGILTDGYKISIISSWLGNIKTFGAQDSQAVVSFDGKGAHVYNNTFLEAASENVLYGGVVPGIKGLTSTNIEFRRCYFFKRPGWRVYNGDSHQVNIKNLFETKNARRLYVEGSVLENHWDALRSQLFALKFKSATAPGSANEFVPWAISEDIVFENNKVNHIYGGIGTSVDNYGLEPFHGLKPNNIKIKNTLIDDLSERWGSPGSSNGARFLQLNNVEDLQVEHTTVIDKDQTAGTAIVFVTGNNFRLKVTNSIFGLGGYGIHGSGVGVGISALNPGTGGATNNCVRSVGATWILTRNVMPFYGNDTSCYPTQSPYDNFYPLNYNSVGFVDLANGDYRLSTASQYKNSATDGKDPGADISLVNQRTACVVAGNLSACGSNPPPNPQSPFPGAGAPSLPATIEAENFDKGGQSIAYNDTFGTTGSGVYRSNPVEGVDVQARTTASNGYAVFETAAGEWLEYSVNAPNTGTYNIGVAYASEFNNGKFHVEIDGVNVTGQMTANTTGNWGVFQTLSTNGVNISAGQHIVRLVFDTNSPDGCGCIVANFDKISFQASTNSVTWQNIQGTTSTGGSIQHSGATYFGLARTLQTISNGGFFEWTFKGHPDIWVGLVNSNDPPPPANSDTAYSLRGDIRENGVYKADTNAVAGDILRIEIAANGNVIYKRNGQTIYTSQTPAAGSYYLHFKSQEVVGNGIDNAKFGNN